MNNLLEVLPELQEDERTVVSTRVFNARLRDENVRTYGSVQSAHDLFERLTTFFATKGVTA